MYCLIHVDKRVRGEMPLYLFYVKGRELKS